jgi:hypothetical protein
MGRRESARSAGSIPVRFRWSAPICALLDLWRIASSVQVVTEWSSCGASLSGMHKPDIDHSYTPPGIVAYKALTEVVDEASYASLEGDFVFKTDGVPRKRALGGFDSRALPLLVAPALPRQVPRAHDPEVRLADHDPDVHAAPLAVGVDRPGAVLGSGGLERDLHRL